MEILDFTYYNQLFESELMYYSFRLPDDLSNINDEYQETLTSILEEVSTFFDVTIGEQVNKNIQVTFKLKKDELSLLDDVKDFIIYFILPIQNNYSNRKKLIQALNKVSGYRLINKNSEVVLVSKIKDSNSLIKEITLSYLDLLSEPIIPSNEEILNVFVLPENKNRKSIIDSLSNKFNIYVQYHNMLKALTNLLIGSETPNIEKLVNTINSRLNQIKKLDLSSTDSNIQDKNILEILNFYKYLLDKSNINNIEKEEVLPALIEVSRILLTQLGSVTEIKKKLASASY